MRTNRSGVTEVAHIRTKLDDYEENYVGIDWSAHNKKVETVSEPVKTEFVIDEDDQTINDMKYLLKCISISPETDPRLKEIVKKYNL